MPSATRSQKDLAADLGLTPRQITNLVKAGIPARLHKGRRVFPWPAALRWYLEHQRKDERARRPPSAMAEAERRKMEAEARLKELELQRLEGELVTRAYLSQQVAAILQRLRARLQVLPGKWAPSLVGCRTVPEALARIRPAVHEAMAALSAMGADERLDQADEADDHR